MQMSYYYQYDHRGNVVVASDSTSEIDRGYRYDAFGNIVFSFQEMEGISGGSEATKDDILFTGKDWDADAGLYYFNARWYDPETGTFVSSTLNYRPFEEHPYLYCQNAPLSRLDPTGQWAFPWLPFLGGIGAVVIAVAIVTLISVLPCETARARFLCGCGDQPSLWCYSSIGGGYMEGHPGTNSSKGTPTERECCFYCKGKRPGNGSNDGAPCRYCGETHKPW